MADERRLGAIAAAAAALSLFASVHSITRHSLTFDAVKYPPSGYDYLRTGLIRMDAENPPLGKALLALPLFLLSPDPPSPRGGDDPRGFGTGRDFFFKNKVPGKTLAFAARLVTAAAAAGLAVLLFLLARGRFGMPAALCALAFLLTEPMYRGLSALATTDMLLAFFFVLGFYLLDGYLEKGARGRLLGAAAAAAAAFLTKFSGLLFFPLAAAWVWSRKDWKETLRVLVVLAGVLGAAVVLAYRSQTDALLGGLAYQMTALREGPPLAFFLDELGRRAWPHYYLVSLVLKTPYPFLIAAGMGFYLLSKSGERRLAWELAVPLLFFLAVAGRNRFYATRYLFPAFCLLCLCAAAAWKRGGGRARGALVLLALWQFGEAAWAHPHHLSYLNLPWRVEGHRRLSNSDFDWGQDLPALADYWRGEGGPPMVLCYFGTAAPSAWGIEAQEIITVPGITESDFVLPPRPARELLAVTAGCRQYMTVTFPDGRMIRAWEWLDSRKPVKVLAGTVFIYDITGDSPAHARLGQLHLAQGEPKKALREGLRVLEIDPSDATGRAFVEFVRLKSAGPRFNTMTP